MLELGGRLLRKLDICSYQFGIDPHLHAISLLLSVLLLPPLFLGSQVLLHLRVNHVNLLLSELQFLELKLFQLLFLCADVLLDVLLLELDLLIDIACLCFSLNHFDVAMENVLLGALGSLLDDNQRR